MTSILQLTAIRRYLPAILLLFALVALAAGGGIAVSSEEARQLPPPTLDEKSQAAEEVAVLAGGCFWGVQGVFQHVKGVTNAVSGYAGGAENTAKYQQVGSGQTGHAEAVRITYNPQLITYGQLLRIYFSVAHDPTQLDRQGPDIGTQYRSAIFPANDEQARIAKSYIAELNRSHVFDSAIATTIEPDRKFYRAEDYHQDFMVLNPAYPYIVMHDAPKVKSLKRLFPAQYRAEPALVSAQPSN